MWMLVFWIATPCGLVGRYQRFRRKYTLVCHHGDEYISGLNMGADVPKHQYLPTKSTWCYNLDDQH